MLIISNYNHLDAAAVLYLLGDVVRVVAQEVEELQPRVVAEVGLDEAPDLKRVHQSSLMKYVPS